MNMSMQPKSPEGFNDAKFWESFYQPRRQRINPTREEKHAEHMVIMERCIAWSELRDTCGAEHEQWCPEYWAAITEQIRSNPRFAQYNLTIKSYDDIIDFADKLREERRAIEIRLVGYPHQIVSAWKLN